MNDELTTKARRQSAEGRGKRRTNKRGGDSIDNTLALAKERHEHAPVTLTFSDGSRLVCKPSKAWDGDTRGLAEATRPGMEYRVKRTIRK